MKSNGQLWGEMTYELDMENARLKAIHTTYGRYKVNGDRLTLYALNSKVENRSTQVGNTQQENREFRERVNDLTEIFRDKESLLIQNMPLLTTIAVHLKKN